MPKRYRAGARRPRPTKRRKFNRKRRPTLGKPSRGLRTSVYLFKRRYQETFQLNNPPANWVTEGNAITQNTAYKLGDLHDVTDFTNLFAQYKISAVKMEMYFASNSVTENPGASQSPPSNMILYMAPNRTGQAEVLDEQFFLDNQATKKRVCIHGAGKPIVMYQRLKQLNMIYGSAANTDYSLMWPRYISTNETTATHTGQHMRLQYVNNNSMQDSTVKVIYTYYISCKQVQ